MNKETFGIAGKRGYNRVYQGYNRQLKKKYGDAFIRGNNVLYISKLNSGVDYRGILKCLDGYMNIALEQTEEYVNGQLKIKYDDYCVWVFSTNLANNETQRILLWRYLWFSISRKK